MGSLHPTKWESESRGGRRLCLGLLALCCITLWPALSTFDRAFGDDGYPTKPIRLVVPYPPGAITDALARAVARDLAKDLGQSVIVENRPGGGTLVGTLAAKNSRADGYTILFQLSGLATNLYSLKQPGYSLADFAAIGMLGQSSYIMFASAKYQIASPAELVSFAKENPGQLNNAATSFSVVGAKLKRALGIEWTDIYYKGGAEAAQAVMSGDAHFSLLTQGAPLIYANQDKLRLMAVSSEHRLPFIPEVPTFKELGLPVVSGTWFGLFVRSETPPAIVAKLRSAVATVMASPEIQEHLKGLRVSPYDGRLQDVPEKLAEELAEFSEEAKRLGIEPQ